MDNKFDFTQIVNTANRIINKFNDPHNLSELTNGSLEIILNDIARNDSYTYSEKLVFFSRINDLRKNKNLQEIIEGALPLLNSNPKFEELNPDWITDFFDKSSKITTEEFKAIWSRVLAEEINNPNVITKRLLHNLFLMSREDAENFVNLSRFCFYDKTSSLIHPILFFREHPSMYNQFKIYLKTLKELEQFSLIECDFENNYTFFDKKVLTYTNPIIELSAEKIPAGNVCLTFDGQKLFDIIEKHNNEKILEDAIERWQYHGCKVKNIQTLIYKNSCESSCF